jgi:hypothetical protein
MASQALGGLNAALLLARVTSAEGVQAGPAVAHVATAAADDQVIAIITADDVSAALTEESVVAARSDIQAKRIGLRDRSIFSIARWRRRDGGSDQRRAQHKGEGQG